MRNWTLAITGKGGVGKTTLAAMAVRWLSEQGRGPVLAVDADPNTCLDALLGVEAACTVGGVREEAKAIVQAGLAAGSSKQELLDLKIQQSLVEGDKFDLIAMGRPEGPGCYCYANNVLRGTLARLAGQYASVVIDNEAGLENLSRRTVQKADYLLFVTDASARGLTTARRLYDLSTEMDISTTQVGVVINRARGEDVLARARDLFAGSPVQVLASVSEDAALAENDIAGRTVFDLPAENAAYRAFDPVMRQLVGSVGSVGSV